MFIPDTMTNCRWTGWEQTCLVCDALLIWALVYVSYPEATSGYFWLQALPLLFYCTFILMLTNILDAALITKKLSGAKIRMQAVLRAVDSHSFNVCLGQDWGRSRLAENKERQFHTLFYLTRSHRKRLFPTDVIRELWTELDKSGQTD